MERAEEYNFRKDVYDVLFRASNYKVTGYLSGERITYNDDNVFFAKLLDSSDLILGKAFRENRLSALYLEPFLNSYKKVVHDDLAYRVYLYQHELQTLSTDLFKLVSYDGPRIENVFYRYWKSRYFYSIKVLYYLFLVTDPKSPKYEGLGQERSLQMYKRLLQFKKQVDAYIQMYLDKTPSTVLDEKDSLIQTQELEPSFLRIKDADLPFLNYIYDKIVSVEYPATTGRLSALRSRSNSDLGFYQEVLMMDAPSARRVLEIGEVAAREVNRLCEILRRIYSHPRTRMAFDNSDKVELLAPRIDKMLKGEDPRTYHAYQKFMEFCNGSVLNLYLRVIGMPPQRVKLPGLNVKKSQALIEYLKVILQEVDEFISHDSIEGRVSENANQSIVATSTASNQAQLNLFYRPALHRFDFADKEIVKIVSINERIGHFPLFTAISCLFDRMDERKKKIALKTLNVHFDSQPQDLTEVALCLNISRERVRQLRDGCLKDILKYPGAFNRSGLMDGYGYQVRSEYDFKRIREEEEVFFSNEYISVCISIINPLTHLIGDIRDSLLKPSSPARRLYLVPKDLHEQFRFDKFIESVDDMIKEKRFFPYRDDLETYVRGLLKKELPEDVFYSVVKECRQILLKGYPDNIINSQIFFPANARKTIPNLIEDILREFNRPMTAEEICAQLNERYPDLEQVPSKIGSNALRNGNIVAVSRSGSYSLAEWNYTEKRGGTIREIVEEYLNSLIEPIATLSDICEYVAKYRDNVKESSVKSNLLAESSNKFSLFYKGDVMYIGYSDYTFDESYVLQEKRQGRRSFKDSVTLLEKFIQDNQRFPYSSGVSAEEIRLSRFLGVCKTNIRKGLLEPDEQAAIERIESEYEQYKGKKERVTKEDSVPWMDRLEKYVTYITINETLPPANSEEAIWYEDNNKLYLAGQLKEDEAATFSLLVKMVNKMK